MAIEKLHPQHALITEVPDEQVVKKARDTCARKAHDAADLNQLLDMLGIGPGWKPGETLSTPQVIISVP